MVSIGQQEIEKADKIYKCVVIKYQELTGKKIKHMEKSRFTLVLALGENDEVHVIKGGRASFEEIAGAFDKILRETLAQIITGEGIAHEE